MHSVSGLFDNLAAVKRRISEAAGRSGRAPDSVELVAVTKTAPFDAIVELMGTRQVHHLGESRIQTAEEKIPTVEARLREIGLSKPEWHMVGHLQTNKAKKAVALFDWVDSVDSLKLAAALDREAAAQGKTLKVLIQVQPVRNPARSGLQPEDVRDTLTQVRPLEHLDIRGLMAIAPVEESLEAVRLHFKLLKQIFDSNFTPSCHLSLGMSGDFEVAIEEGATMVRVGSLLFGESS